VSILSQDIPGYNECTGNIKHKRDKFKYAEQVLDTEKKYGPIKNTMQALLETKRN